ncbi:MAG: c-type cytochrome [Anaerolineaceae bacterium]|nr:c-type cytochrome [Anaerolineaceae bacterium]
MKKTLWVALLIVVLTALVLASCGSGSGSSNGSGLKRNNPPADYANAVDPFEGNADAATQGKELYTANCVACHGENADGSGPAGAALDPKPANLQLTVNETSPAYMHWVITEGGQPTGLSASMVSYKGILSEDEIWKIVTYLNSTYKK